MKRTAISLMVLVLFFCMGASTQAEVSEGDVISMPNALCVQWEYLKHFDQMVIKLTGIVNTADGPVKYYEIHGAHIMKGFYSVPITGTGYRKEDIFHYSYSGTLKTPGIIPRYATWVAEGKLNLTTGEGTLTFHTFRYDDDGNPVLSEGAGEVETYVVDCGVCPAPAPYPAPAPPEGDR